jgi:hypothetical protein
MVIDASARLAPSFRLFLQASMTHVLFTVGNPPGGDLLFIWIGARLPVREFAAGSDPSLVVGQEPRESKGFRCSLLVVTKFKECQRLSDSDGFR